MLSCQMNSSDDKLACRLCELRSNNLNNHTIRTHKVSIEEYKERFPGAQTCRLTPSQIERMANSKHIPDSRHQVNKDMKLL
jgi:hypothetical protein